MKRTLLIISVHLSINIAIVGRPITTYRESNQEKKQKNNNKYKAKKIKCENFTRSNREYNDHTAPIFSITLLLSVGIWENMSNSISSGL